MKKNASPENENRHHNSRSQFTANIANPFNDKLSNILFCFAIGGTLNRFEAERIGDHCLNSTISTIRNRLNIPLADSWELVPNRFGTLTRVKRYLLPPAGRKQAVMRLSAKHPEFFQCCPGVNHVAD